MPYLVARVSWMPEYRSEHEASWGLQRYVSENNRPYESLNFLRRADGRFHGYIVHKGDAGGAPGNLEVSKLGAARTDDAAEDVTVIFCARSEAAKELRVVGAYLNSTVFRSPKIERDELGREWIVRAISPRAVLIPEPDRHFAMPRGKGAFGQSDVWYGLQGEDHAELRRQLDDWLATFAASASDAQAAAAPSPGSAAFEERRRRSWAAHWEGRARTAGLLDTLGHRCAACGYEVAEDRRDVWGSGIEAHHLVPWSSMEDGARRTLRADDFAPLCALCHRAIHRTPDPGDVTGFARRWFPDQTD
ncbi:HNH endonuclease [Rhodovulum sp. DZ06]|uniref:HNH endonuclease n=1 Tax=Rhodovulum sp. DZ06 TaxID=3425126 RepID=UPI003D34BC0B